MRIRPGNAQHIGLRNDQEDSFAFSHIEDNHLVHRAGVLAVLADGMGGLAMGKEASDYTVKALLSVHEVSQIGTQPEDILRNAVKMANHDVLTMARKAGVEGETGSTLVAIIVKDDKLYWTSVGDSRIYLYRAGELVQLTTDQNYGTELLHRVANGLMSMEEAQSHPDRAALTNFIGYQDIKLADSNLRPFPIVDGDWIVLCSDGLFNTLTDDEIREELHDNPHEACERLIQKVVGRNKPKQDNTTVAILACGNPEPRTVRTKNAIHLHKIITPKPQPKKFLQSCLIAGLVCILATALVAYFWFQPHNTLLLERITTKERNIQKPQKPLPNQTKLPMANDTKSTQNANASK